MNPKSRNQRTAAFTLLELVVVLAILAVVTGLAIRAVDQVDDERRYDVSLTMLEDLEAAVLGNGEVAGFVSDMGRLPRAVGAAELSLAELWAGQGITPYDVRTSAIDAEVSLPAGWRGPYLRLPLGTAMLRDGWGNPMTSPADPSPANPLTTGYHRLRTAADAPITASGTDVAVIRHLGANGEANAADEGADRDLHVSFANRTAASVTSPVRLVDGQGEPAPAEGGEFVKVRVFGPNPDALTTLAAAESGATPLAAGASEVTVPGVLPATAGFRAVRAYLYASDGTTLLARSQVKYLTLRPGANFVPLVIRQP